MLKYFCVGTYLPWDSAKFKKEKIFSFLNLAELGDRGRISSGTRVATVPEQSP